MEKQRKVRLTPKIKENEKLLVKFKKLKVKKTNAKKLLATHCEFEINVDRRETKCKTRVSSGTHKDQKREQ